MNWSRHYFSFNMEQFFRAVALVLLAVILVLILRGSSKGIGELLSLLVCCMVAAASIGYIEPVVSFVRSIQALSGLDSQLIKALLKVVGISVTAEIASLICDDAGNSAMGKALQFMATAVIICISLPMLTSLLQLIEGILKRL